MTTGKRIWRTDLSGWKKIISRYEQGEAYGLDFDLVRQVKYIRLAKTTLTYREGNIREEHYTEVNPQMLKTIRDMNLQLGELINLAIRPLSKPRQLREGGLLSPRYSELVKIERAPKDTFTRDGLNVTTKVFANEKAPE